MPTTLPFWEDDDDVLVADRVDDGVGTDHPARIIVFNDNVNSFDWVIDSFVKVLKYGNEQAEQLSIMIHFKGKATVKSGKKGELLPLRAGLIDRGLTATVEEG